jgi:hypothetical protein
VEDSGVLVALDRAISNAANTIKADFDEGTVVAVLDFNSGNSKLDDYVMQELEIALVQGKKLAVTERKNIAEVRQEKLAQLRGDVSDETSASIGKEQGWKVVILGNLFDMKATYRFRVRAVLVEEALIATAYAVDVSPQDRKVRNLLEGRKPPQLRLGEEGSSHRVSAPKVYMIPARLGFAWGGQSVGFALNMFEVTFSPVPYFALGMEILNGRVTGDDGILSLFPIHAGILFPVREGITAVGYGKMHWLGGTPEGCEPLLNTGFHETDDRSRSYQPIFITPGIKAGLVFHLVDDNKGNAFVLELSYTGTWFTQRYISSIGLGLVTYIL